MLDTNGVTLGIFLRSKTRCEHLEKIMPSHQNIPLTKFYYFLIVLSLIFYKNMLKHYKLVSLRLRRIVSSSIFLHRTIKKYISSSYIVTRLTLNIRQHLIRNMHLFYLDSCVANYALLFFSKNNFAVYHKSIV